MSEPSSSSSDPAALQAAAEAALQEELAGLGAEAAVAASSPTSSTPADDARPISEVWRRVLLARHPQRPTVLDWIGELCGDFSELHGDRRFGDDPAMVAGMAEFRGRQVLILGQQRGREVKEKIRRNFGMAKPEGYRKAMRLMRLADKFHRPVVALIDTQGAYPGVDAEERGQAEAIAWNLREMARLQVPVVATVVGEGGSGGALGIGMGNRVLMLENAMYSVISPEGCASIMWRDAERKEAAAAALKLTASELLALRLVDEVVPEPPGGAHLDGKAAARLLGDALDRALAQLETMSGPDLQAQRCDRFRSLGHFYRDDSGG
ncbi:MAG: acetyl-CoA carboxylase carboxyltransferase subunit alpha [Terriglobales bacterium]